MSQVAERHGTLVADFDALRATPAFGPEWLRTARASAFGRFLERGFPTTRDEEWKFTNVAPIAQIEWRASAARLSVKNQTLPEGVTISSLQDAWDTLPAHEGPSLKSEHPFVLLNTAFFEDGLFIHIAPKTVVTEPIHIVCVAEPGAEAAMVSPRVFVVVGEQAQVSLVESYFGTDGQPMLVNAVTEVLLGPGAVVDHVKVQQEASTTFHLASTFVHLHRASTFTSQAITFGGRIARNDISATLAGEGAECTLNGLYVADGETLVDTHTTIDHAQPHCPSHEVYKGILTGKAKGVFNGKIIVRPDAQKTDAKQTNKALLLSGDASINTKPQLEIFADDVKCTHGATIGQLDDQQMFYLRARGIHKTDARNMLIHAFASDVLNGIRHDDIREQLEAALVAKLHLPA
ncbi:MAG: Fe-S cluster assembly protein SufD [Acidobacteria bacterium]|jgi:Fe-S cluster assembly protein SufD|nr:Fe-S cluster assembly protein SufD [Acidobacteriota bacterium]